MNQPLPIQRKRRSLKQSDESVETYLAHPNRNKQGRSPRTKQVEAALDQVDSLEKLLAYLKITNWNYLFMGDGSATGKWEYEAGFACVVVPRSDPTAFYTRHGAFSRGTNIVAEMMAYVLPLMELSAVGKISVRHVHIVTDCEYIPKASLNPQWQMKANSELWMMLRTFKKKGLVLHWHWLPRDKIDMNKFCHDLANSARVAMKGLAEENMAKHEFKTIDVNARAISTTAPAEETNGS